MYFIYKIWNRMMFIRKKVSYGQNLNVNGLLFIHGEKERIKIGNNVMINSSSNYNPTSGFNHTHLKTVGEGSITIGDSVGISHANIIAFSSIIIEDNVLIGSGVKIWDTDFHSLDYSERVTNDAPGISKSILIREGAFIGACSIVLKGVTIGKHAIVGAGSVVTRNIPDNEIWAGNPAKFVKKLGG